MDLLESHLDVVTEEIRKSGIGMHNILLNRGENTFIITPKKAVLKKFYFRAEGVHLKNDCNKLMLWHYDFKSGNDPFKIVTFHQLIKELQPWLGLIKCEIQAARENDKTWSHQPTENYFLSPISTNCSQLQNLKKSRPKWSFMIRRLIYGLMNSALSGFILGPNPRETIIGILDGFWAILVLLFSSI